jgi:hypothetical protein
MTLPDNDIKSDSALINSDKITDISTDFDYLNNPIPEGPVQLRSQAEDLDTNLTEASVLEETKLSEDSLVQNETDNSFQIKKRNNIASTNRELTVNSLMHLMGLPTNSQVNLLDTKLDLILSKLGLLQSKVDRLQSQFELINSQSQLERVEFQLTEIRSIMKKFFPDAFKNLMTNPVENLKQSRAQVLSNSSSPSTKAVKKETSIHIETKEKEEKKLTDEEFQIQESNKLREKST